MVRDIRRAAINGTRLELESLEIWPEGDEDARPTSEFFVNQRIDLMVREAETYRNDYRNKTYRDVFLALRKPLPWMNGKPIDHELEDTDPPQSIETLKYCAFVLLLLIGGCLSIATYPVSRQNRLTM